MIHDAIAGPLAFSVINLGDGHSVTIGQLPDHLLLSDDQFEVLWQMHPVEHARIVIHGRSTPIPRWHRAYGRDYRFSGQVAAAVGVPSILQPLLDWGQAVVDDRLNGILVNWCDGALDHYIGPHHDDQRQLVNGTSIMTISFGEERVFRLVHGQNTNKGESVGRRKHDLMATPGSVIVIPWATNIHWKHCVPKSRRYRGRRISITLRAFSNSDATGRS